MECSIPQLRYSAFSEKLFEKTARLHIPVVGSIEITQRCNLRCRHCYLPLSARRSKPDGELSFDEIRSLLDEIKASGGLWLLLTGGEPLLRKDFQDIYLYAKRKGFILSLFTNGTLLTPRLADLLAEWRPFNIEVTLYGATQATYERVTGIPGSYSRCRAGIDRILERGLPLKLKTVLLTLNREELGDIEAFARSLGVEFRFDPVIDRCLDGSGGPAALRLKPDEIAAIEHSDPLRRRTWPEIYRQTSARKLPPDRLYTCGAGTNSYHIDSYGQLCMCLTGRHPSYDLRSGSFQQGWEEFIPQMRAAQASQNFPCARCSLRSACMQCPAYGILEHGDPEKPVDFLCKLAHSRAKAFDQPAG